MVKIAINGFGRIGRLVFRAAFGQPGVEIVAINDTADAKINAHLLKYDSVHGTWPHEVSAIDEKTMVIDGVTIPVYAERNPADLPWGELGVELVVESTGVFNDAKKACAHITAGAKKVVLTAPGKNEDVTIVMGVNEDKYDAANHHIISNASCTTNCLAPVAKVLDAEFGIKRGLMTTVHAYTNDQCILDRNHKDFRRARAGACSMIPTTTGAAKAVALVLPQLAGKLNGFAVRVPTANVSMVDLVAELDKPATAEEINTVLKTAAEGSLQGILGYCDLPLVSCDYNGCQNSSTVDALSTMVIEGNLVKVVAWYDNEWGYSNRVVDLVKYIAAQGI